MDKLKLETFSFAALFAGVSILLFFVFAPFIQILTLAAVLAILFHKPYLELRRTLSVWRSVAAFIVVALVFIFFIVPLFLLGWQIFLETGNLYAGLQGNGAQYIQTVQNTVENIVRPIVPGFTFNMGLYLESLFGFISSNLAVLVSGTFYIILETFLMLLAFFFFLRDGEEFVASIRRLSPFREQRTREILRNMHQTTESIMKGTLLVGIVRWVLISLGFYVLGIPNSVLWGGVGGIVGAVPGLGTPFVFIPAVAYLYLDGSTGAALWLAVYGIFVIILADNFLTPYFFRKGMEVPSIFVLFSILGGILFFGPLGFILGPIVLSVFLSILHIYTLVAQEGRTAGAGSSHPANS